jgi:hypothetical protein
MFTAMQGYTCPRCGKVEKLDNIEIKVDRDRMVEPIYVLRHEEDTVKVNQTCPNCGYYQAYRRVMVASGEHAGVKRDRSLSRYRCIECNHSWVIS